MEAGWSARRVIRQVGRFEVTSQLPRWPLSGHRQHLHYGPQCLPEPLQPSGIAAPFVCATNDTHPPMPPFGEVSHTMGLGCNWVPLLTIPSLTPNIDLWHNNRPMVSPRHSSATCVITHGRAPRTTDNAQPHTARMSHDCFRHITTFPWSARFPDLSPTEHIWDHLGWQVGQPTSFVESGLVYSNCGMRDVAGHHDRPPRWCTLGNANAATAFRRFLASLVFFLFFGKIKRKKDWLYVFTDGSATASFDRVGAGAFSNSFNLKEPLSAWSDNFDGDIYAIFMAFRAISTTPGLNIVIFIDSAIKTAYLATIYSHQNLSSSANNLSTHFFAPEERSFSNGSHLIAAFMEMNKPTSWPKRLRRCIYLAFRCLFETPSDFSGTNCDRREFPLLETWLLANLGLVCSMAKNVFSFLPYLGWRVWHVSESSPDIITCKPICLRLAWLIHRFALSVNSCQ
ncbi:hypothetical protein TNCV_4941311 [Trichonephila clavipes]|nr:hypothetical protein TNCV_4941311 [Trichonephila clavipes]